MKKGQQKYTNQELVEKITVNTIPEVWERKFEMLDGHRATTIQQVQTILQKVERVENWEKRSKKKEDNLQKNFKDKELIKKSGKYKNPCKKPGHDNKWEDYPGNWKNKKYQAKRNKRSIISKK